MEDKGLRAVVINAITLEKAEREGRDLWQEARECKYQVILLAPESVRLPEFDIMIKHKNFRARWGLLVVDESHLVDEWGEDFRELFRDLWTLRTRAPEHTTVASLSGSIEPGPQMSRILKYLGFSEDAYHLDKQNCERDNIDFVFREIRYAFTGYEFRDLDWLIPEDMEAVSSIPKRMLFVDTIELSHRITLYLRSLLPDHLLPRSRIIIRHVHSILCSECKREALDALLDAGNHRETALFVTTAILDVGVDPPDVEEVVIYPTIGSASTVRQRPGRIGRRPGSTGRAYFYFKKSDIEAAVEYSHAEPKDPRILEITLDTAVKQTISSHAATEGTGASSASTEGDAEKQCQMGSEPAGGEDHDREEEAVDEDDEDGQLQGEESIGDRDESGDKTDVETDAEIERGQGDEGSGMEDDRGTDTRSKRRGRGGKGVRKTKAINSKLTSQTSNPTKNSRLVIISALPRRVCILQQIGKVYDDGHKDEDCGRCSNCVGDVVPEPRALPVKAATEDQSAVHVDSEVDGARKVLGWEKLLAREKDTVAKHLQTEAFRIWTTPPFHSDALFFSSDCFLTESDIQAITNDFHLVLTKDVLQNRLNIWRYWERYGDELWMAVARISRDARVLVEKRHDDALAKAKERRDEEKAKREEQVKVRDELEQYGLANVRRVKLLVGSSATRVTQAPTSSTSLSRPSTPPPSQTTLGPSNTPSRKRQHPLDCENDSQNKRPSPPPSTPPLQARSPSRSPSKRVPRRQPRRVRR